MLILVVEDNALIAMMLEATLADAGHTVGGPASTAKRAIELAEVRVPDLALVDIHLWDDHAGGVTFARELHRRWGVRSLFLSGNGKAAYEARGVAFGYLEKPYDPKTVLRSVAIAEMLKRGEEPSPGMIPRGLELFHSVPVAA